MTASRVWVADRWMRADKTKKPAYGQGDRWRVVWIDPETKRERSRQFSKKTDADAFRAAKEHSLRDGAYVSPEVEAMTVGEVLTVWMSSKKRPKDSSLKKYEDAIAMYVRPRWGGVLLTAVQRPDVEQWLSALIDGSAPRKADARTKAVPLAPATAKAVLLPLNAALRYAVAEGWLKKNPAYGVELPKTKPEPVIFLNYRQLESLVTATRSVATDADALMVAVLGNVGLRPGEAVALQVSDVNLQTRRISISKTITTDREGRTIIGDTPKTDSGIRDVPIPPHLIPELAALTKGRAGDAPLFPTVRGQVINLHNWRDRVWRKAKEQAKMPADLTPKGLRHTAASLAIAAGADVLVVRQMLGHADATETLNTYAKLWPDRLDQVTSLMSRAREAALLPKSPGVDFAA